MTKRKTFMAIISTVLTLAMMFTNNIVAFAAETSSATRSIDSMLLKSQEWLNDTYSSNAAFGSVPEDGTSRRSTVNGCIRALQIELGITVTANNFGAGTESRFKNQYPNGVVQQEYPSTDESNVYGIIQCALWTKGYSTGSSSITKHFYDGTGNAIIEMKEDMGFVSPDSTVTLNVMKSLLSMHYFVLVGNGTEQIRQIQQELNRTYPTYLGIIPCDGLYTRSMNKSLIIALQAIEGYSEEDATGNFGSGTKANLPLNLDDTSSWASQYETYKKCIKLIQYALCCNGYGDSINLSNSEWNSSLSNVVKEFQSDLNIDQTGKMNVDTWMALLLSKGNTDRSCTACDTRYEMTQERIDYLKANGYSVVGRYLTGSSKGLKDDEPRRILANGLSFFPIFQETLYSDTVSKYNYELGISDAQKAIARARELGIPSSSIIYFAIDFDPVDSEIASYVIPYFRGIKENIGEYDVGIYGTRNACTQVINLGYATTCFVSDMSTGYSGNMGFKIPSNWNLDQFYEYSVTTESGTWDIDKVSYSGKFPVVDRITKSTFTPFEFIGDNTGNEFFVPKNVKKVKYTVKLEPVGDTADQQLELYVYFNMHLIDSSGKSSFERVDNIYFTYPLTTEGSSGWLNVYDSIGYQFNYTCKDLNQFNGTETNPGYADGTCKLTVTLEYQY